MKNAITFTAATLEKISADYYNLSLYNSDKLVYKGTVESKQAAELIDEYYPQKLKFIKNENTTSGEN